MMPGQDADYNCRICGQSNYTTLLSEYKTDSSGIYSLRRCNSCFFVSTFPFPNQDALSHQYDAAYWQEGSSSSRLLDLFYALRSKGIINELKGLVSNQGKILDWGSGDCRWLKVIRDAGFKAWGIDLYSTMPHDQSVKNATIETAGFSEASFDAITAFHLLEHLPDPVGSIREALKILKPGGVMIVETPNIDSWGFRIFKKRWQPLQLPAHLNHFSPKTLRKIFENNGGVEIIKISHFSHRASPAALVVSIFPGLEPRRVRGRRGGKYPDLYKIVYLFLQVLAYVFSGLEAAFGRGDIIRLYARKAQ